MKKIMLMMFLAFGLSQTLNAQAAFGIKGGVNYNSNSINEVQTDLFEGAESRTGYHAGIWLRFKIPVIGLYLRPELVYTNLSNEVRFKTSGNTTEFNFQKIDIPVLLGKKIFSVGNVFIGPSFQYVLGSDFSFSDISEVETDGFTVGLQFGGGIELGKLGIDVRWERAFSDVESNFLSGTVSQRFDTRINQIIVGLSYRL
ncbi:PorT family protein [Polaribacter sp. WD7]|uniref:porin family protein n=1 Tax=Polaribacter sp. WD7 TaxID=2269061 RepID=UPI000DF16EA2|nr:porin family protein [Polaribacter sp. WD7]RCS26912.1 PorT family protein [Polaribacter sp. WD7]